MEVTMSVTTLPPDAREAREVPLACVPGAIPASERASHFARLTRLFTTDVRERAEIPGGYAFRFDADAFDELARWITLERRCCPFLDFGVQLTSGGGPIWVRLTGPAGTREFLDAELPVHADAAR
jgi:hypothetical protein